MTDCLFCKIAAKELPSDMIYEDDKIVVFKDIRPKADVHLLVVPRIHVKSLNEITPEHRDIMFYALTKIPELAKAQGLDNGYRTVLNTGRAGGQEIDHIHFHLLGGPGRLPGF